MTPREKLIAALQRKCLPGPPPHLELVYQITDQWPGVPWLRPQHLEGYGRTWRDEILKNYAEIWVQIAREFDWSVITGIHGLLIEDQCRLFQFIRDIAGDTYMLSAFCDGTFAIPGGAAMMEHVVWLSEQKEEALQEAQRRVDEAMKNIKALTDAGAEIVFMCSDYCFNNGPFLSPHMFSEFIAPFLKQQVDYTHKCGAWAVKHSDGQIMPILDQIVDCGVDAVHSLDPMAGVDIAEVRRLYGDRVCLIGNVNCALVQNGTTEEIQASALYCLEHGGANTGGYVFSTSNCIFEGVPLENYRCMLDVRKNFCR